MFDADTHSFDDLPHRLRVGDYVTIDRDVLAELGRDAAGLPPTWFCIPAGTHGRLIGWRDREDEPRAIIDVDGTDHRLVVFVGERNVSQSPPERIAKMRPVVVRMPTRRHRVRHRS